MSAAPFRRGGSLDPEPPGYESPSSCSSATHRRGEAPGARTGRSPWQPLPLLLPLLSLCLANFYVPLLGLRAVMASMASHCVSISILGLGLLWCGSLPMGGALTLILVHGLCVEWLLPVQRALWRRLTIARAWSLRLLSTLLCGACQSTLCLLRHLQWEASLALFSMAQWAFYSLLDSPHENSRAVELLLLRVVLQPVAMALLARFQDRMWAAMGWVARAIRERGLKLLGPASLCWAGSKDLDAITTNLPATTVPFSQRFPGPDPAALRKLPSASISLCVVNGDTDTKGGQGGRGLGATSIPLSTRFQSSRLNRRAARRSSRQALAQQVKASCVLIALLYIYAASVFVQILK